jgi:hypothetical protein
MSRGIRWTGVVALILLVVGLIIAGSVPSVGSALAVIGLILLGGIAFVVNARARRARGWTRVWNPGAARREYKAEQASDRHDRELGRTEGDDQER